MQDQSALTHHPPPLSGQGKGGLILLHEHINVTFRGISIHVSAILVQQTYISSILLLETLSVSVHYSLCLYEMG